MFKRAARAYLKLEEHEQFQLKCDFNEVYIMYCTVNYLLLSCNCQLLVASFTFGLLDCSALLCLQLTVCTLHLNVFVLELLPTGDIEGACEAIYQLNQS